MDGFTPQFEARECRADVEDHFAERDLLGPLPSAQGWRTGEAAMARLVRTIEGEIIPRLMLAHRDAPAGGTATGGTVALGPGDVAELTRLVLAHGAEVARAFVAALRAQGAAVESIYLDLLAPAARRLGKMWEDDLCDFSEVTIGLYRLQQAAHALREVGPEEDAAAPGARRVLLIAVPGEHHTFGLSLVAEFFRRAGWSVCSEPLSTGQELLDLVRRESFSIVGLSVSRETRMNGLASIILGIRRMSCNRAVGVMVGGRVFSDRPELVAQVGADATAADARQAVAQAQTLLDLLARAS
jgi:methanogenic corrinoid protein MtbC1